MLGEPRAFCRGTLRPAAWRRKLRGVRALLNRCVVFSHGKDAEPWGSKIVALAERARERGYSVESVDYRGIDSVEARLDKLISACAALPAAPVLVGSSLGAFLAAAASRRVAASRLFLIAPAVDLPGLPPLPEMAACPTTIVHGWRDEVVPVEKGIALARAQRATLHVVDDDHRLHSSLPRIVQWFDEFLR